MDDNFNGFEDNKSSVFDNFVDVLTAPKEIFKDIADSEVRSSNYFIPLLTSILFGILFIVIAFSQPTIQYQIESQQIEAMQKMVDDGKMTMEQFEQAKENNPAKPGTPLFLFFGSIGVIVGNFFILFFSAFVFWLIGKLVFSSSAKYLKITEVVGLTSYVTVINTIITLIFVLIFDSLYKGLNLAFFIADFDLSNKLHLILKSVDLLMFWWLIVLSIGFSEIWKVKFVKTLATSFILYAIYVFISVFIGLKFS